MRYIDSNILAYAFYENEHRERCQELIKEGGITNTVNVLEAFNIIQYQVNTEYATTVIRSLLKSKIIIIEININSVFETLKRTTKLKKLKINDLLHYTIAVIHNCSEIASFDHDFDNLDIPRVS